MLIFNGDTLTIVHNADGFLVRTVYSMYIKWNKIYKPILIVNNNGLHIEDYIENNAKT